MSINNLLPLTVALAWIVSSGLARSEVCNLKVVTDASPDYSDMASLVHSVTARWDTPEEKCWAMFYWNHIARRQTAPMILHGTELTDPIRQFNDYGYTMCSTISGINCAIWHNLGLKTKFWDISLHTVPEVLYDGRWHMYDNSMSALYTLCDGRTLAGVEDIGKEGACSISSGQTELGHVAKYHCLYSTGPNGFLTGADTQRSLDEESRCFNPHALKFRPYYFNWDFGHRYILNLRPNEVYTRYYSQQGTTPEFFVPNHGKDPDDRYHIRGNGLWSFKPSLASADGLKDVYKSQNVVSTADGLRQVDHAHPGSVTFKIQAANVITSQKLQAQFLSEGADVEANMSITTNNGLSWKNVWQSGATSSAAGVKLTEPVNGAYEVLARIEFEAKSGTGLASLKAFEAETTTMVNAKTQPRLNLGKNTVFVGTGEQSDSIVFWPELQNGKYKENVVEERNINSAREHPGYQGTLYPAKPREDAYLVYKMEAPRDLTKITFGGRFYNRAPKSHIDMAYSLDGGKTWQTCWSLRRTSMPWDVIHYETLKVPPQHRSILLRYLMNTTEASPGGCSIYALRMEANYAPADTSFKPLQVVFNWSERQADRSLVQRFHLQTISHVPFKYTIDVGGADHPIVNSLQVNLAGAVPGSTEGYSDGRQGRGDKFVPNWVSVGKNLALGKEYTLSKPSGNNWGAGDDGKKLTSGAGGPSYAGGTSYRSGALWLENVNPAITVDLGSSELCASFGLNLHGYPWWDALKGEIKDRVEVLTSPDGNEYTSQGFLRMDLRWVDLPANFMWTDEETMTSATFRCVPARKVSARYVKFQISNKRIVDCAGIEVLDEYSLKPFDLRIALPDQAGTMRTFIPPDNGA